MKNRAACSLLVVMIAAGRLFGQASAPPAKSATAVANEQPSAKQKQEEKTEQEKLFGKTKSQTNGPVTTEIYADEAFFDSNKNMGTFTGHVKINDPRFTLQSEKLTVYISKGQNQALEKAVAEGNVAVVRDRPDPNGGPPTRAVGRADKATYTAATGDVELAGTPRVQEGVNIHVATSPDTVMVINQNGQLTTHGPSRTEIRQEPKKEEGEKKARTSPVSPTPKPKPTP
jgi:lipopolysaccharide transport protein LptA